VDLAFAGDLGFEPLAEGVDAFCADPVETAGVFVGALAEFTAGVEVGEDEFDGWDAEFGVGIDGDAAAVVADGAGAVGVESDVDGFAVACEVFVDGVVEDLEDAVVETAFIGVADVHAWAFADGLEAFEFIDLVGTVGTRWCGRLHFDVFLGLWGGHGEGKVGKGGGEREGSDWSVGGTGIVGGSYGGGEGMQPWFGELGRADQGLASDRMKRMMLSIWEGERMPA
jgi:hypothetical protein